MDGEQVFEVQSFTEKPDLDTAKDFLEDGDYLWNLEQWDVYLAVGLL
nr:sugar phosphate nucleotidyltransferase [Halanaerobium congolense]